MNSPRAASPPLRFLVNADISSSCSSRLSFHPARARVRLRRLPPPAFADPDQRVSSFPPSFTFSNRRPPLAHAFRSVPSLDLLLDLSISLRSPLRNPLPPRIEPARRRDLLKDLCLTTECTMNYINFAFSATPMYRPELIIAGVR